MLRGISEYEIIKRFYFSDVKFLFLWKHWLHFIFEGNVVKKPSAPSLNILLSILLLLLKALKGSGVCIWIL